MKKYICNKCKYESDNRSQFAAHIKWHRMEPIQCSKCKKIIKDKSGFKTHERYCSIDKRNAPFICPVCNRRIKASHKKHLETCNGFGPRRSRPKKKRGGWNKGKSFEEAYGKERAKILIDEMKQRHPHTWEKMSEEKQDEIRKKARKNILNRYKNGWEPICGRSPKIKYESYISGKMTLDGTWELLVAIYLDNCELHWKRNKKRFNYYNTIKGMISTYCPDFYVEEWKCYIEVKGHITYLDYLKWGQFPERLKIWDKYELIRLHILQK